MNDSSFMGGFQRFGDLFGDWQGFIYWDGTLGDPISEGRYLHQLQHQGPRIVGFLDAVDRGDAGVVQTREDLRFPLEPGQPIRISGERFRKDLQRHLAVQLRIGGLIHLALVVPLR